MHSPDIKTQNNSFKDQQLLNKFKTPRKSRLSRFPFEVWLLTFFIESKTRNQSKVSKCLSESVMKSFRSNRSNYADLKQANNKLKLELKILKQRLSMKIGGHT